MRIVVTGAAGFIGSHTCEALIAAGHEVVGFDSFDSYLYPASVKRRNANELEHLPNTRFRLVTGDLRDRSAIASVISADTDVVCHLAALAGVRPSLEDPTRYVQTNVEGTSVLLERMRTLGLQRLVMASSSSVYGAKGGERVAAFREDDPCLTPASPYAATKRMNELQLETYRSLYGIGSFALRFFTVYGPRQRPDMAIHKFVHAIASGQPITLFGDGSSSRDYTFISDIVAGTVSAIARVTAGSTEIVNLGGTVTTSLRALVGLIETTVGKTAAINWQPTQPGDVPITYADTTKAHRLLGYAPTIAMNAGLAAFWDWFRRRA